MKVAVVGAGAVGCFFGARLAEAGQDVLLVGRDPHISAIKNRGLHFESATTFKSVPLGASTDMRDIVGADVVLVCVKSMDSKSTAKEIRPYLTDQTIVVSLQNGIDNANTLAEVFKSHVIPAAVYVACEMVGEGHLMHHGRGDLAIGSGSNSSIVASMFSQAAVPTVVYANVDGPLWDKLILNCSYNAISAIVGLPYKNIRGFPSADEAMKNVIAECLAVAKAEGINIDYDLESQLERVRRTIPPGQYSSMAQDFARGKPSEIAALNGVVVQRGKKSGVPTPANQLLVAIVHLIERNRRHPSVHTT
ncbi:ketopantoate reductase family protein [Cupriavidus pauculus]|uniref:2-dehydropantoate 2-reductase n=1 Tax=Cupriavidus pauculus TaxID=82633 RepID=A0A2N5C5K5_9BURK|nr:ketopantoate reductase family protein [Cupriavidus pauculus]PLP97488.1 2-dehydropantoate 2-reductase [Cupriavidus pauculus]